jgi:nucleoside 2-deoxyribosyltransferase
MNNKIVAYIAGPYSGDVNGNIRRAEEVSIELIKKGYSVITPQKNTAYYERYEREDLNLNTWMEMDFNLIERCDVVFIMENWENSIGVAQEKVKMEMDVFAVMKGNCLLLKSLGCYCD